MRTIDMIVCIVPPLCPIIALTVYVSSIIFCFDPLFLVLQDWFSNTYGASLIGLPIRMFFTSVCFEVTRSAGFMFVMFVVIVDKAIQGIQTVHKNLSGPCTNIATCYRRIVKLMLIYRRMSVVADFGLSALYSGVFWIFVLGGWLVVNGYGLVPTYIYWMLFCVLPPGFVYIYGMLLYAAGIYDMSAVVIRKLRCEAQTKMSLCKSYADRRHKTIWTKKCHSLLYFAMIYLPVSKPISRLFARDWFETIVDRLFDAIILF